MTPDCSTAGPNIARLAALLADPARAQILLALMDGRALTAGELARAGGVSPQTASSHLGKLLDGGLLATTPQGRHRYYRIADAEAAHAIETLSVLSGAPAGRRIHTGPRDGARRSARICYDHLAGEMGVALMDGLVRQGTLAGDAFNVRLTEQGSARLRDFGIDVEALARGKRPLCRSCLDWSERRPHLAGGLGAALLDTFLGEGWIRRQAQSRALTFSGEGLRRFDCLIRS